MGDSSKKMANFAKLARGIDNFKIATFSHPSSIAIILLTCAMCTINLQKNLNFIHSEKASKFCEIFPLLLSFVVPVESKVEISQKFVAFSEYMNFNNKEKITTHLIGQETLSTIGDTVTSQICANAHSVSRG